MGHHINKAGEFQSDQNKDLAPDHVVLSFHDPRASDALHMLAAAYRGHDDEFAGDILERLRTVEEMRQVIDSLDKR